MIAPLYATAVILLTVAGLGMAALLHSWVRRPERGPDIPDWVNEGRPDLPRSRYPCRPRSDWRDRCNR